MKTIFSKRNITSKGIFSIAMLLIAVATISCSKDNDQQQFTLPQQVRLIGTETTTNSSNSTVQTNIYTYDGNNRLVSDLTPYDSKTYARNEAGKVNKMTVSANGSVTTTDYFYNTDGTLQRSEKRDSNGLMVNKIVYSYYSDRYEDRIYNATNDFQSIGKSFYTPDGNISLTTRTLADGSNGSTISYTYDDKNGTDKIAPYSDMPKPHYNTNNVVTKSQTLAFGITFSYAYELTYDASGFPLTIVLNSGSYASTTTVGYIFK